MREQKPSWDDLPAPLQRAIEARLGAPVARSERVYGGYGPSVTLRIVARDGARLFVKGAGPHSHEVNWAVTPAERALYESGAVAELAPEYRGALEHPGWHLLLLEDLGQRGRVPPWTVPKVLAVMEALARFHATATPPPTLAPVSRDLGGNWRHLAEDRAVHTAFLNLWGDRAAAGRWLDPALMVLMDAEARAFSAPSAEGFLHTDVRSDNLRVIDHRLVLFDWANASCGPVILDPVFFVPSLAAESGFEPDAILTLYLAAAGALGLTVSEDAIDAAAALTAGYFAARAGLPVPAELPRLRLVQQAQLGPALAFAARRLHLPPPPASPLLFRRRP